MVETRSQNHKRKRIEKSEEIQYKKLIFEDILSRLSIKSLCSSKSVNKYWRNSINNIHFIKHHLTKSRQNPLYISCPVLNQTMKLYISKPKTINFRHLTSIGPSEIKNVNKYMISSFNGLICYINFIYSEDEIDHFTDLQIHICNPSTGDTLLLPQGTSSFAFEPSIGVAYDLECTEYKVFRIFRAGYNKKTLGNGPYPGKNAFYTRNRDLYSYECEVYSSRTCSWKNIGQVPRVPDHDPRSPYKSGHVFVKGKVYWVVSLTEILCVDMEEERFEVIEMSAYPAEPGGEDGIRLGTYLINLQESLSLVILHRENMDIWVWNGDSWALKERIDLPYRDAVLAVSSCGTEIVCGTETFWWTYDVEDKIWKRGRKLRIGNRFPTVFPFVESILPCKLCIN